MTPAPTPEMVAYLQPIIEQAMLSEPILRQIPTPLLSWIWPRVIDHLQSVIERTEGRWTLDTVADDLIAERWQLWVVWDGSVAAVVATELFFEASGQKAARIVFTTGQRARDWTPLIAELEAWARNEGCLRLEMLARKGWARHLPDYKMTHVLLEKDLRDGIEQQDLDANHVANA